tara:strand:- start:17949 stop:18176 length:228 start_codon:yes stop_codon:yes gene_type:complete
MIVLPIMGWMVLTIISQGKKLIVIEERVNDSLTRRLSSLEDKVDDLEAKIETKIDILSANVTDCKLTLMEAIQGK